MSKEIDKKPIIYAVTAKDMVGTCYMISPEKPTPDSLNKGHPIDFAFNPMGAIFYYNTKFRLPPNTKMRVREITEPAKQIKVFLIAKKALKFKRNIYAERLRETDSEIEKFNDFFLFNYLMKNRK